VGFGYRRLMMGVVLVMNVQVIVNQLGVRVHVTMLFAQEK
jgi:hypothetical protein